MDEKQAGITAFITAYARAYHATHDSPKIFDDFLADEFYTTEEHISFDANLAGMLKMIAPELEALNPDQATALAWVMQIHHGPITLSRSRYAEDKLEEAIRQGIQQYVILGAGMDTFAFRRPELASRLQVFEIDHPITQALKRQRISTAGWDMPPHLHFVPVDFSKENLVDALKNTAYDPQKPVFFSWLGVSYYLCRDVFFDTLQSVASVSSKGSKLIFDYIDAEAFIPGKAVKTIRLMQQITQQIGEPMKNGFDPLTIAGDLKIHGYRLQENLTPVEIQERYFQGRTDRYHAVDQVHFAMAVTEMSESAHLNSLSS